MKKQFEAISKYANRIRWYFKNAENEINQKNMRSLQCLSVVAVLLIFALICFAPLIISDWEPSVYHILFVPVVLIMCVAVQMFSMRGNMSRNKIIVLCAVFWIILFAFVIMIDIFSNPSVQSCFMPLLCVALPTAFVLPVGLSYGIVGVFEVLYLIGVLMFKDRGVGQYDAFTSVCALGMSFVIYYFIMYVRAHDYQSRVNYETLSKHDPLIHDIYNKQSGFELVGEYLNKNNPDVSCSFIVLDVDDFKNVNDTLGHYAGDRVLRRIGDVLLDVFDGDDIVARFGGDEFVVFAKGLSDISNLREKCGLVCERLGEVTKKEIGVPVTCSIGGVVSSGHEVKDFNDLFCQADLALYAVKEAGKARHIIRDYTV